MDRPENMLFRCIHCKRVYAYERDLDLHLSKRRTLGYCQKPKKKVELGKYHCRYCKRNFKSSGGLGTHLKRREKNGGICTKDGPRVWKKKPKPKPRRISVSELRAIREEVSEWT